jgi:hypothetical protein
MAVADSTGLAALGFFIEVSGCFNLHRNGIHFSTVD